MTKNNINRGVFYSRDSGGRHETTPGEYVLWACGEAKKYNVVFNGSPDQIDRMVHDGIPFEGDIYFDYGVSGNKLSRPALDKLFVDAISDPRVTHLFIPKRDRLARPDNPIDGVELEAKFRDGGISLVFQDLFLSSCSRRKRSDIGELLSSVLDYHQSGKFCDDLGRAMIYAQISLAKSGFSTGGRAPFGFCRWLVKLDGKEVRQLEDGERVKRQGHHVVWLPGPEAEVNLALRIRQMLLDTPASQVASILNGEGIPSPNAGRYRTDNGRRHLVKGVWHQSTIVNIGRNPLFIGMMQYGARSMGDQVRFTPDGPRELDESDIDSVTKKPKVICNPKASCIAAKAFFDPIDSLANHEELNKILDQRAGTQRGKPRCRTPAKNPLGCRVFDMNCGSPMYRVAQGDAFRYVCGLYKQSHGQKCAHNKVDGPMATRFGLSCIRQKLVSPNARQKLRLRLEKLAQSQPENNQSEEEINKKQEELTAIENQLATVSDNLARAKSDEQHIAISKVFDQLIARKNQLESELANLEKQAEPVCPSRSEVDQVMHLVDNLTELAGQSEDFSKARELFNITNFRLFVRFEPIKLTKRTVNKLVGGVAVFGEAADPVKLYDGPTSTKILKKNSRKDRKKKQKTDQNSLSIGEEDQSLRNVSRGDTS